ncbi:hypothetical protein [Piscirickettsia salmonis]|uniref:hypothetical protein n=1 Tax=Piscirickettsia salmonis TaxID=1238 RepID=UPI0002F01C1B|nr:hypothetical protein [Piscirickettsia salmonis]ERL61292.1 hypothetical protein K661_02367 [Piscirickettsia salmonis LF-89 = ATCC VR-1361]PEQ17630.1 hypothetical protein X973_01080 [Piscirickettsia salmonis]QGN77935.1 hypothetical protein Psal001_02155 [Piscirickettsia salmonis]QGN81517.1 hypothetical protein Psal002_02172 [Piscirickettsia salmonis]QGN84210.1 hypothetical protein Psal003_01259 [Piscirickettsia salmonis]
MSKYEYSLYISPLKYNIEDDINYIQQLSERLKSRLALTLLIPARKPPKKNRENEQTVLDDKILEYAYEELTAAGRLLKISRQDLYLHTGECPYTLLECPLSYTRPDLVILPSSLSFEEEWHFYKTITDKGIPILKLTAP